MRRASGSLVTCRMMAGTCAVVSPTDDPAAPGVVDSRSDDLLGVDVVQESQRSLSTVGVFPVRKLWKTWWPLLAYAAINGAVAFWAIYVCDSCGGQ